MSDRDRVYSSGYPRIVTNSSTPNFLVPQTTSYSSTINGSPIRSVSPGGLPHRTYYSSSPVRYVESTYTDRGYSLPEVRGYSSSVLPTESVRVVRREYVSHPETIISERYIGHDGVLSAAPRVVSDAPYLGSGIRIVRYEDLSRAIVKPKPTLYFHKGSQPSRAVYLFCLFANIDIEAKIVDILQGEHKQEPFLKINPTGQIPALDDNGFKLSESHTIMRYLSQKYGAADHWYPHDVSRRARVDQYLDWHHNNLRKGAIFIFHKLLIKNIGGTPSEEAIQNGAESYRNAAKFINDYFLNGTKFIGGDLPSIADCAAYCEIQQLPCFPDYFDMSLYPNVTRWIRDFEAFNPPKLADANEVWNQIASSLPK